MALTPGTRIGSFQITGQLGRGGMGEVYRARDTRLDRDVAIKVLPEEFATNPERVARFEHEAKTLAALKHPNIAGILGIEGTGEMRALVLELIEGRTLADWLAQGPIPIAEALSIARQIADGLGAAHGSGIIHRDLKPANVMLTKDGWVKLLDFGLAKAMGRPPVETTAPTQGATPHTAAGAVLGTAAYMSPEQAAGQSADARSDIFAFGAVLYEMVTGRCAFAAPTQVETLGRVLREDPRPARELTRELPQELERVIDRCLRKDPNRRSQHIGDVKLALDEISTAGTRSVTAESRRRRGSLWRGLVPAAAAIAAVALVALGLGVFSTAPSTIGRIAVLPLDNISGDAGQEYFADGMTEALIDRLGRISALRVTSRTSVMRYKGDDQPASTEIATVLGVDALVDGSAARVGDQVRVTAQLIDAHTDQLLWSDTYDRPFTDTLVLQSEIAQAIAEAISVALTPEETEALAGVGTVDPDAYEYFLRGQYAFNFGPAQADVALEYFQRALDHDPDYGPAHAGIGGIWGFRGNWGFVPWQEAALRARRFAQQAIRFEDASATVHSLLARVALYLEWDWSAAEREFLRAIDLDPSQASTRFEYGLFLVAMERLDEAVGQFDLARELDPLNPTYVGASSFAALAQGRYEAAVPALRASVSQAPGLLPMHMFLWGALAELGELDGALDEARQFHSLLGNTEVVAALDAAEGGRAGYRAVMRRAATALVERSAGTYVSPVWIAQLYASAGETAQALTWLERAFDEHNPFLPSIRSASFWNGLRSEPRFRGVVDRMNFPDGR